MFHGVNPAMGWLFAVALGMQQRSRAVVLLALVPIAIGHAVAVAIVVFAVIGLGLFIDERAIRITAGGVLIAWAFGHWLFGARPTPAQELTTSGSLLIGLAAVGAHTVSMLATTGLVAVAVYEYFDLAFLRRGWINLDLIWTMALLGTGLILVAI